MNKFLKIKQWLLSPILNKRVVMTVGEDGSTFKSKVYFTLTGKAYVRRDSYTVAFLDNPDQKEGEIRLTAGGKNYKRWFDL